jgi:non-canonical poly(A) RNA polymerase PAPD5/7
MTDSYRPQYRDGASQGPPPTPPSVREAFQFTANTNSHGNRLPPRKSRGQSAAARRYNDRHGRPATSSRPLLRMLQDAGSQSFLQPNSKSKFRDVDTLTDSDDSEMLISDDDSRPTKKTKVDIDSAVSTLKWSNPDPYTALPPPPEPTGKHMDVVGLIRKARVTDDDVDKSGDLANNADFISFDGGLDLDDSAPRDAPEGPRADRHDHLGKRKRGDRDATTRPPGGYLRPEEEVPILSEWTASDSTNSTPWLSPFTDAGTASIA